MINLQAKPLSFLIVFIVLISGCAAPTRLPAATPFQASQIPFPEPTFSPTTTENTIVPAPTDTDLNPTPDSTVYWPTNGWKDSSPEHQGMDSETLVDMLVRIQKQDYNIDSLTIIRNGTIVTDATFYPFTKDTPHIIHSCTKSIVSTLVGIAIDNGYIENVDQPVLSFFPEMKPSNSDTGKQELTLEHLLMMASGLDCRDSYLYNWRGLNEMRDSADWVQYMLDLPMAAEPGTRFEYCNGGSYLLAAILQQTTGMSALTFAEHHLFDPLGITDVHWPASPQGINIGWGDMYLKPHDMAKIGFLYLNEGRWEDKQVVPSSWVQAATSPQIRSGTLSDDYGYQWWVDSGGYYMALGFAGQFIFVIPEKNMVVIFTSGGDFPVPESLLNNYILPAATADEPLPPNPDSYERLQQIIYESANPPDPEPITTLPGTAERISGHTYSFDPNNLDFKQFSLTFNETEAVYTLSYRDRFIEVDVGLDGVYQLTDAAGYTRAFRAYWENDETFTMNYEVVGYSEKGRYIMVFEGDQVSVQFLEESTGTSENLAARLQN